jgi:hypothetical protein
VSGMGDPRDTSTDQDTKYRFVPVVRRGYPPDAYYGGESDRGKDAVETTGSLQVDLTATGERDDDTATEDRSVDVQLYGPGHVTGLDERQVVRTEPEPETTNFPPNYFATVAFDPPDMPWLFSPVSDDTLDPDAASPTGKSMPWLTLVVLEKTEELALEPGGDRPLPSVEAPLAELPPLDEAWAWAHAQVVGSPAKKHDGDGEFGLDEAFTSRSTLTRSRLVSPRNLQANTRYVACVVPTFEAGVKAGLGEPVPSDDESSGDASGAGSDGDSSESEPATMGLAWSPSDASTADDPSDETKRLPVLYHWEFATGKQGDFEFLARQLESRNLSSDAYDVGKQTVDVTDPGPTSLAQHGESDDARTVEMGGALRKADADPIEAADYDESAALKALLNAPDEIVEWSDADLAAVGPPVYGGRHAQVETLPASFDADQHWLRDLNLAPGNRLAAAVGAGIVRDTQEQLMDKAWDQVGAVREANRTLAAAQLSRAAMETSLSTLRAAPDGWLAGFTAPLHDRSLLGDGSGRTVGAHLDDSALPRALASAPFRRLTSESGRVADRLADAPDGARLVERVADGELDPREQDRGVDGMGTAGADVDLAELCESLPAPEPDPDPGERDRPSAVETLLVHLDGLQDQGEYVRDLLADLAAALEARDRDAADDAVDADLRDVDGELGGHDVDDEIRAPEDDGDGTKATPDRSVPDLVEEIETEWLSLQPTVDLVRNPMVQVAKAESSDDLPGVSSDYTAQRARDLHDALAEAANRDVLAFGGDGLTTRADPLDGEDVADGRKVVLAFLRAVSDVERYLEGGGGSDAVYLDGLVCEAVPESTPDETPDLDRATALDPVPSLVDRVQGRLGGLDLGARGGDPLDRVMAYPEFPKPTYDDLKEVSEDYLLPGVSEVPKNTVGALETNPEFIESFMVGLNHEMASELLWRRYPTDRRGSYFRQFWDPSARVPKPDDRDLLFDVTELHTWDDKGPQRQGASPLGSNVMTGAGSGANQNHAESTSPNSQVVVVIRGELLQRYPTTTIYATKAKRVPRAGETDATQRVPEWPSPTEKQSAVDDQYHRFPIFRGELSPDVSFLGFDLTDDEAVGETPTKSVGDPKPGTDDHWVNDDGTDDEGWFFVLEEPPGEVKFGLDVNQGDVGETPPGITDGDGTLHKTDDPDANPEHGWSALSWGHLVPDGESLDDVTNVSVYRDRPGQNDWKTEGGDEWDSRDGGQLDPEEAAEWGLNSAHMAYLTWQRPVRIAIHASDLLPGAGGSTEGDD